jgi:glycosyltransferase involved in cell wall biosynthesis
MKKPESKRHGKDRERMKTLDIVIPIYNERVEVVRATVKAVKQTFRSMEGVTIILVDDGSDKKYDIGSLKNEKGIVFVQHEVNRGYGAALKFGILNGRAPWIGIIDADGTYPAESLAVLAKDMDKCDMVVGIRTGKVREIPWSRRLPKTLLNRFASYLAGLRIRDLNSGLRLFSRDLAYYLWGLFPSRFSFTSTLTMGALMGGFRVRDVPIDYYRRTGKSSMRPVTDTARFFRTALRLALLFSPMRVFGPTAGILFTLGFVKGILRDYVLLGQVGNLAVTLMLTAVELLMLGLLGELIVHSRSLKRRDPAPLTSHGTLMRSKNEEESEVDYLGL